MADLLDLAARVEQASGPDRELDNDIRFAARQPFNAHQGPSYTASLDAGKTLLAPGTLWTVGSMEDGPFARLCWPQPDGGFVGGYIEAKAKTAENALVSAALRARSAQP